MIVAPYEADPQLAYLSRTDYVDLIISEDSDMLVFGSKRVFFKMGRDYNGELLLLKDILNSAEMVNYRWTMNDLIQICILSGCDYLNSPKGIGLQTSFKNFKSLKSIEPILIKYKHKLPDNYFLNFQKAFLTFKYAKVYCPRKRALVNVSAIPTRFLGLLSNSGQRLDSFSQNNARDLDYSFDLFCIQNISKEMGNFDFLGKSIDRKILFDLVRCEVKPDSFERFTGQYLRPLLHNRKIEGFELKQTNKTNNNFDKYQKITSMFGKKKRKLETNKGLLKSHSQTSQFWKNANKIKSLSEICYPKKKSQKNRINFFNNNTKKEENLSTQSGVRLEKMKEKFENPKERTGINEFKYGGKRIIRRGLKDQFEICDSKRHVTLIENKIISEKAFIKQQNKPIVGTQKYQRKEDMDLEQFRRSKTQTINAKETKCNFMKIWMDTQESQTPIKQKSVVDIWCESDDSECESQSQKIEQEYPRIPEKEEVFLSGYEKK